MTEDERLPFAGRRILVVEDDYLVARSLARLLRSMGATVVGPAGTPEEACALIRTTPIDAAFLDVSLSPGTSAPVARALLYRGSPFVFITGYGNLDMLPDDLRGYRVLHKPVDAETLISAIKEMAPAPER
jgi:DNA-binding NtrC family response regulator